MREITLKEKMVSRLNQLDQEKQGYMDYWRELANNILAFRGRHLNKSSEANKKPVRNTAQYNNTPRMANRTLASGMMAGITSPARPWFALQAGDPRLNEVAAVKEWLKQVERTMYKVFSKSNAYNSLHTLYGDIGTFAISSMGVYENFDTVIRCKTYTIGSYAVALGADDKVDTWGRDYIKTVAEVVKEFGIDNVSEQVKRNWEEGKLDLSVNLSHLVEPNDDRNSISPFAGDMPFRSVYFEKGFSKGDDKFLRKSGFEEFPFMVPRWNITGEGAYSDNCPGMDALGDCKALQLGEKRYYQALDKIAHPPLNGDEKSRSKVTGGVPKPGEVVWNGNNSAGLSSIYTGPQPAIDKIRENQHTTEKRINSAYYADLFLMLANSDRRQITAREIAEKHEEKLLMLGPVLERLHSELLDPLINRTFAICQRAGIFPPPPEELLNTEMTVDYISVLAQAQKLAKLSSIEKTVGFAAEMSAIWPEARHKIDAMQAVDEYANDSGANPSIVRPDDEVSEIMENEQKQKQQADQMAMQSQQVQTAKTASEVQPPVEA